MTVTRLALRGAPDRLATALDWCLVRLDVSGVLEGDGEIELAVDGDVEAGAVGPFDGVRVERLPSSDVTPSGFEGDEPICVGEHILVRPPWVQQPDDFDGTTLVVPRGGAFGSGEHASTQAALLVLERCWVEGVDSFADVGTGSGILALYGATRGVGRVLASDVDPAAVRAARELVPNADVREGGGGAFDPGSASTVVANLNGRELAAELEAILQLWNRCGALVLSGMRVHEVDPIVARVPATPAARERVGEFVAIGYSAGP